MNKKYFVVLTANLIITIMALMVYSWLGVNNVTNIAIVWSSYTCLRTLHFTLLDKGDYQYINWSNDKQPKMIGLTIAVGITTPLFLGWYYVMLFGILNLAFEIQTYRVTKLNARRQDSW